MKMTEPPKKPRRKRQAIDYEMATMRLLSKYHYLTPQQVADTGLVSNDRGARAVLARLINGKKAPVARVNYAPCSIRGRRSDIYYLTKYGADLVMQEFRLDPEMVSYPKGKPSRLQDYWHRRATIDFHIVVDRFTEAKSGEVQFFHTYFDHTGANRSKASASDPTLRRRAFSKITFGEHYLIPDVNFLLVSQRRNRHLFTGEIYNGRDTGRVIDQLLKHVYLISENVIADHYQHNDLPWRVLSVFETKKAMLNVARRFASEIKADVFKPHFAFSTLPLIRRNFATNWMDINGKQMMIFEDEGCSEPQPDNVVPLRRVK